MPMFRYLVVLAFVCLPINTLSQAGVPQDDWTNLTRVSHRTSLVFIKKDGRCSAGTVLKVDDASVTVHGEGKDAFTIEKTDVLQVGDTLNAHNLIYSGRSSWNDVMRSNPSHAESLKIQLKKKSNEWSGSRCYGHTNST
jgi:hypothetical protein